MLNALFLSLVTAFAATRERRGGRVLLLPLCAVQLLHQGQAEPHPARPVHEAPAQREPAQAAAAAEGPARGRGGAERHLHHPQVSVCRHG